MARPKAAPGTLREATVTWRTTFAGKRAFKRWCLVRRLDMSEVNRLAVTEFMKNHEETYPVIAGAEND